MMEPEAQEVPQELPQEDPDMQMSQEIADVMETLGVDEKTAALY